MSAPRSSSAAALLLATLLFAALHGAATSAGHAVHARHQLGGSRSPAVSYSGPYGNPLLMQCRAGERNVTIPGIVGVFCAPPCSKGCPGIWNATAGVGEKNPPGINNPQWGNPGPVAGKKALAIYAARSLCAIELQGEPKPVGSATIL